MNGITPTNRIQEMNACAIVLCKNRVLLMERDNNLWEFPGGGVDFGEHPYTSAVRECEEETGLKVSQGKFLTITSAVYEKNGAQKHSVYAAYIFDLDCSNLTISNNNNDKNNNGENNNINNTNTHNNQNTDLKNVKMNFEHKKYVWVDITDETLKNYKLALNAEPAFRELLHYLSGHKK